MLTKPAPPPSTGKAPTDPYARGGKQDAATADSLVTRFEVRGTEPPQRAPRQAVLSRIPLRAGCRVLEVGTANRPGEIPGDDER